MTTHFTKQTVTLAASLALSVFTHAASASLITNGFTFAVASSSNDTSIGNHFHSSTGGAFGNPSGKAEVGRFGSEEVRGLSEYNLTGLSNSATAFVTFDVFNDGGLFTGTNDFPFDGTITVEAYSGNNTEDISDYQASTVASIGSFSTTSLGIGDILSFDITSVFNDAIDNSLTSLGMRLRADPLNTNGGAWTFDTFRLTTDNQSTSVPEPATIALIAFGLLIIARARRTSRA